MTIIKTTTSVTAQVKEEFIAIVIQLRNADNSVKLKLALKRILLLLRSNRELCTVVSVLLMCVYIPGCLRYYVFNNFILTII